MVGKDGFEEFAGGSAGFEFPGGTGGECAFLRMFRVFFRVLISGAAWEFAALRPLIVIDDVVADWRSTAH
jgi:hypothetical protein